MRWWVTVVSSLASVQHKRQEETNLFFYIFCDHDLLSFIVNDWKSVEKMEVKLERLKVSHLLFLCLHCSSSVLSFLFEKETALSLTSTRICGSICGPFRSIRILLWGK